MIMIVSKIMYLATHHGNEATGASNELRNSFKAAMRELLKIPHAFNRRLVCWTTPVQCQQVSPKQILTFFFDFASDDDEPFGPPT